MATKTTASATSRGRSICALSGSPGSASGSNGSHSGVSVAAGSISDARTPVPRSSSTRTSWNPRSPNFDAE